MTMLYAYNFDEETKASQISELQRIKLASISDPKGVGKPKQTTPASLTSLPAFTSFSKQRLQCDLKALCDVISQFILLTAPVKPPTTAIINNNNSMLYVIHL
ncbi:hypothetical protein GQX74_010629 [Glossina fuscipes]|nr:hypothetical protein GQX74_010629 [Glossina fuscipes]